MLECNRCSAGNCRARTLRYEPIVDLGTHPINAELKLKPVVHKDIARSTQVRQALKGERRQIDRVNRQLGQAHLAQATKGSGRINHDGDAKHLGYQVERKHRFNSGSVSVSKHELDKGVVQDIDIFEIYLALRGETYYVLRESVYLEFLQYAAQIHNSTQS
jgi:hypothetical protein